MGTYQYEAVDQTGRSERGVLEADSERLARQQLMARGLLTVSLKAGRSRAAARARSVGLRRSELSWLTRQLASLVAAGLSLEASLGVVMEQASRRPVAQLLADLRADIRAGQGLSDALSNHPRDFPDIYQALVRAGEQSGELEQVLDRLASFIEDSGALRGKVLTAFIYPAIVSLISAAMVVFLLSYVVPQVVGAFTQAKQQLPLLTRVMIAASDAVRQWGGVALLMLLGAGGGAALLLKKPAVRLALHRRLLRVPVLGGYLLGVDTARFAATLAILVGSNVALLTALEAAGRTLSNLALRDAVAEAAARVREGLPLAAALQRSGLFPPLLVQLIASGEKTGELAPMLDRAATTLSAELERRALTLTALLEPLMILLMGGLVLMIVLAVMLPIIEMNQLVQ
ncbi:type II secretion system inner membrane protein GspF [Alcaligenes sp. SDU_A2]|uniref:type II secretion system inner membrane protein GspF n=1 Tax=Alcaligenes sp. SDU_A2 TaxID=3136634 RepID=UPI00311F5316